MLEKSINAYLYKQPKHPSDVLNYLLKKKWTSISQYA